MIPPLCAHLLPFIFSASMDLNLDGHCNLQAPYETDRLVKGHRWVPNPEICAGNLHLLWTVLSVTDAHPIIAGALRQPCCAPCANAQESTVYRSSTCPPRHCLVTGPHIPCQDAVQVASHRPIQATPVPRRDIDQGLHDTDALRLNTDLTGAPPSNVLPSSAVSSSYRPSVSKQFVPCPWSIHGHRMPFRTHTRLLFTSCVAVVVCLPSPAVDTLHSLGTGSRVLSKWTLVHLPIAFRRVFYSRRGSLESFGLHDDHLPLDETWEARITRVVKSEFSFGFDNNHLYGISICMVFGESSRLPPDSTSYSASSLTV